MVLAIAIGIIIILAAILGYNAVRQAAAEREGRDKLGHAKGLISNFAAGNNGTFPTQGQLAALWTVRRAQDYALSPWGGQAANTSGVTTLPIASFQAVFTDTNYAGMIIYTTLAGNTTVLDEARASATMNARKYVLGYVDNDGTGPKFTVIGE